VFYSKSSGLVMMSVHCIVYVQNGLWDDLTETDELMSTAMSFSGSQLSARSAVRVKKNPELQPANSALLASSANTTCRSYHSKGLYATVIDWQVFVAQWIRF